jgi:3-dehydrosphinganine reductase
MRKNKTTKNVLITGGSSGIGLALAREYIAKDCTLFLIARNPDKLEATGNRLRSEFPGSTVHVFTADVANEAELISVYSKIASMVTYIDALICNAGVLYCGRFESNAPNESHKAFEINYWGMHFTVFQFLPLLKAASNARVAFVSSIAGYTGLFGYAHYAPSKFAVAGLAECLRMEFKDHGIGVSVIYPPDTETPMLDYERAHTLPECRALSKNARSITAQRVAAKIVRGIHQNTFEIYFNFESRFIRVLKGLFPGIYYRIVDRIVSSSRKQ